MTVAYIGGMAVSAMRPMCVKCRCPFYPAPQDDGCKKNTPRGRQFEKESVYLPTISNYNILVSMNVQTIGENAGIVYRVLASEHREWSYSEVKEKTGLPDRELNAAIGWLAREGKLGIEETKAGRRNLIYLTLSYYNG